MIQNLTPEEKDHWDKSMSRYQQRLHKNSRAFRWFIVGLIGVIILVTCLSALYSVRLARKASNLPVHQRIDTTWIEEHSEIPEDPVHGCPVGTKFFPEQSSWDCVLMAGCWTDHQREIWAKWQIDSCAPYSGFKRDTATFTTTLIPRKSVDSLYKPEEDSVVKYGSKSLWMYHGFKIVAIRPNKTWDWLVLDSPGYKIAIVKAKRRDSL